MVVHHHHAAVALGLGKAGKAMPQHVIRRGGSASVLHREGLREAVVDQR